MFHHELLNKISELYMSNSKTYIHNSTCYCRIIKYITSNYTNKLIIYIHTKILLSNRHNCISLYTLVTYIYTCQQEKKK